MNAKETLKLKSQKEKARHKGVLFVVIRSKNNGT